MAPEPFDVDGPRTAPELAGAASAAWAASGASRLAEVLGRHGVAVLVLKGAHVQRRLLGTESAYPSADVDLLVERGQARLARSLLRGDGWRFLPENGLLWRVDRAAAFERRGVVVDLHWGIHLGFAPPMAVRPLERALWDGARRAETGLWEPRLEPLLVYLALHAAAFDFTKPPGVRLVEATAGQPVDWVEVEAISRRIHAWPAVRHAVARAGGETIGAGPALLTGWRGRLLVSGNRLARTSLRPGRLRRMLLAGRRIRRP